MATSDVEPLDPDAHSVLGLREDLNFAFASAFCVAPLMLAEIAAASVWYPIVFTEDSPPRPAAVMGFPPGANLYVRADGAWRWNAYVPAVIRRHPFLLKETSGGALRLCVQNPLQVLTPDGRPFFVGGEPTALYKSALEFCRSLVAEEAETAKFVNGLLHHRLLTPRTTNVRTAAGITLQRSFLTLDERRLRELDADAFLDLRRHGWISAIFAQLNSTLNWHKIGDLYARAEHQSEAMGSATTI